MEWHQWTCEACGAQHEIAPPDKRSAYMIQQGTCFIGCGQCGHLVDVLDITPPEWKVAL